MKQVMNYNKDNGLLNMIRRTDPMIKINGTNGVTINDSFEVKNGASLEIRTN